MSIDNYYDGIKVGKKSVFVKFKKIRNTNSASKTCDLFERFMKQEAKKLKGIWVKEF